MYEAGLFIGRMQHIHNVHEALIRQGLSKCKKFLVLVGSAQIGMNGWSDISPRNPFSANIRIALVKKIFEKEIAEGRLIVAPLDDMTTEDDICFEWGRYLLAAAEQWLGQKIDYMIYGNDESRQGWFAPEDIEGVHMDVADRIEGTISATKLRDCLLKNNEEEWRKHTNPVIHSTFQGLSVVICLAKILYEAEE